MNGRRPRTVLCDAGGLPATATAVERLARLQLHAHRSGAELQLRNLSSELEDLLAFLGLRDVLPVEGERQSEEREERGGVKEEGQLDDAAT